MSDSTTWDGGCPDCGSQSTLTEIEPHVYRWLIEHDDTCPVLLAIKKYGERNAP